MINRGDNGMDDDARNGIDEEGHPGNGSEIQSEMDEAGVIEEATKKVITELSQETEEWHAKADEYLDKYRRSAAEFSNYRRRQERDAEQRTQLYKMDIIRQLLPILDDLQRAVVSMPDAIGGGSWGEGVTLIERKFLNVLSGFSVVPIEAQGERFDPRFHSALLQAESEEYEQGVVMEELQMGYMMGDQVIRPTLVKVSLGTNTTEPN